MDQSLSKVLTLMGFTLIGSTMVYLVLKKRPKEYKKVGVVKKLIIYPIKSVKGIELNQVETNQFGLKLGSLQDRSFLLINADNRFITLRQEPSLTLLDVTLDEGYLIITTPEKNSLRLPLTTEKTDSAEDLIDTRVWGGDIKGINCGSEAETFFSNFLGKPGTRLIRFSEKFEPRAAESYQNGSLGKDSKGKILYHDASPCHVINENSVEELNSRLSDVKMTYRNFRPTILVEAPVFSEDDWEYMKINNTEWKQLLKCTRCKVTTVDTETGDIRKEPIETLKKYRTPAGEDKGLGPSPMMGIHLKPEKLGQMNVGDEVWAVFK